MVGMSVQNVNTGCPTCTGKHAKDRLLSTRSSTSTNVYDYEYHLIDMKQLIKYQLVNNLDTE